MKQFFDMIDRINECGADGRGALEQELLRTYQRDKAVLALDMSGFSLNVRRSGILGYLCCIRRMQRLVQPLLPRLRGELIKFEADNLLAAFDRPADAVAAAIAMHAAIEQSPPPADGLRPAVGIGLDYGAVLLIPGQDCYGDAVNIAYKLGEDVAQPGETLMTRAMADRIPGQRFEAIDLSIGGLQLAACRIARASARA
jgi:adenylate cyclase